MEEHWKPVLGYEGIYEVSNLGNVRSVNRIDAIGRLRKGTDLIPSKSARYNHVSLCKGGVARVFSVHRLVALAFLDNHHGYLCVNHKNENTRDNRDLNLEWCTSGYNNSYGVGHVNRTRARSRSIVAIDLSTNDTLTFQSISDASRVLRIALGGISECVNGLRRTFMNYKFYDVGSVRLAG